MATNPTDLPIHFFAGRDGVRLAYREMGQGRLLILIHGFFSTAMVNWVRYGHAARIAQMGYRVVMPDLRAHGDSAKPHEARFYPPDVLADDGFALLEHLNVTDFDLGGYSLGGRTTLRMLARGAKPGRAVVAGAGWDAIVNTAGRGTNFRHILTNLGTFRRGSAEWMAEAFLKTVGGDPVALLHILDTFVDTPPHELASFDTPTLVVLGSEDHDTGSGRELAAALVHSQFTAIPGNHMSAVTKPELGAAMAAFLANQALSLR